MTRLKIASIGILAATTLATAGFVAVGAMGSDEPKPARRPPLVTVTATVVARNPPRDAMPEPPAPTAAGPGIEGRIVDLEGRPIAGARVEVTNLWSAPDNNLDRWIAQVQDRGVSHPSEGLSPGGMVGALPATSRGRSQLSSPSPTNLTTTITGADGRFHLPGIGPEHLAEIRVTGPTIATTELYVMGRDGAEVRATRHGLVTPSQIIYHARKLEYAAAPSKPIEGVVSDKDTGRPIAGVALRAAVYDEHSLIPTPGIEATTDDRGRYRLAGLPRAPAYRIFIEPGSSGAYTKAALRAAGDSPAFEPLTFDIGLKRGILVRGKVTDKATGQPVNAAVDVYAFADNPHVRDYPGFRSSALARSFVVDGRYEIVALPGRCIIAAVMATSMAISDPSNCQEESKATTPSLSDSIHFRTCALPAVTVSWPRPTSTPRPRPPELDLRVDAGRTITVTPSIPRATQSPGQPRRASATGRSNTHRQRPRSRFTPSTRRSPGCRRHASAQKLIGSVYLKGDEPGPLLIPLQPYGTVTGRIVDEEGRPRAGVGIMATPAAIAGAARRARYPARQRAWQRHPARPRRPLSDRGASSRASSMAQAPPTVLTTSASYSTA